MSQGATSITNGSGSSVRAAINAALARLATVAAGTGRPADIATYEYWIETDNPGSGIVSIWQWDGTNDVLVGMFDTTAHAWTSIADAMVADSITADAHIRTQDSVITLTGTSETLLPEHNGKTLVLFNVSPITLTIPIDLPEGFGVVLMQTSSGQVTLDPDSLVTLISKPGGTGPVKMNGLYAQATLNYAGNNDVYLAAGDLTT